MRYFRAKVLSIRDRVRGHLDEHRVQSVDPEIAFKHERL